MSLAKKTVTQNSALSTEEQAMLASYYRKDPSVIKRLTQRINSINAAIDSSSLRVSAKLALDLDDVNSVTMETKDFMSEVAKMLNYYPFLARRELARFYQPENVENFYLPPLHRSGLQDFVKYSAATKFLQVDKEKGIANNTIASAYDDDKNCFLRELYLFFTFQNAGGENLSKAYLLKALDEKFANASLPEGDPNAKAIAEATLLVKKTALLKFYDHCSRMNGFETKTPAELAIMLEQLDLFSQEIARKKNEALEFLLDDAKFIKELDDILREIEEIKLSIGYTMQYLLEKRGSEKDILPAPALVYMLQDLIDEGILDKDTWVKLYSNMLSGENTNTAKGVAATVKRKFPENLQAKLAEIIELNKKDQLEEARIKNLESQLQPRVKRAAEIASRLKEVRETYESNQAKIKGQEKERDAYKKRLEEIGKRLTEIKRDLSNSNEEASLQRTLNQENRNLLIEQTEVSRTLVELEKEIKKNKEELPKLELEQKKLGEETLQLESEIEELKKQIDGTKDGAKADYVCKFYREYVSDSNNSFAPSTVVTEMQGFVDKYKSEIDNPFAVRPYTHLCSTGYVDENARQSKEMSLSDALKMVDDDFIAAVLAGTEMSVEREGRKITTAKHALIEVQLENILPRLDAMEKTDRFLRIVLSRTGKEHYNEYFLGGMARVFRPKSAIDARLSALREIYDIELDSSGKIAHIKVREDKDISAICKCITQLDIDKGGTSELSSYLKAIIVPGQARLIEQLNIRLRALEQRMREHRVLFEGIKARYEQNKKYLTELEKLNGELSDKVFESGDIIRDLRAKVDELERLIGTGNQQVTGYLVATQENLGEQLKNAEQMEQHVANFERYLPALQRLADRKELYEIIERTDAYLQTRLKKCEDQLNQVKARISGEKLELIKAQSQIKDIESLGREIQTAEAELQTLITGELKGLNQEIEKQEVDYNAAADEVQRLQKEKVDPIKRDIYATRLLISQKESEIKKLNAELNAQTAIIEIEIENGNANLAALRTAKMQKIDKDRKEGEEYIRKTTKPEEVQVFIDAINQQYDELAAEETDKEKEQKSFIAVKQSELEQLTDKINVERTKYQGEITALTEKISSQEKEIEVIRTSEEMQTADRKLKEEEKKLEGLKEKIESNSKVEELHKKIEMLEQQLKQKQEEIDPINNEIEKKTQELEELMAEKREIEGLLGSIGNAFLRTQFESTAKQMGESQEEAEKLKTEQAEASESRKSAVTEAEQALARSKETTQEAERQYVTLKARPQIREVIAQDAALFASVTQQMTEDLTAVGKLADGNKASLQKLKLSTEEIAEAVKGYGEKAKELIEDIKRKAEQLDALNFQMLELCEKSGEKIKDIKENNEAIGRLAEAGIYSCQQAITYNFTTEEKMQLHVLFAELDRIKEEQKKLKQGTKDYGLTQTKITRVQEKLSEILTEPNQEARKVKFAGCEALLDLRRTHHNWFVKWFVFSKTDSRKRYDAELARIAKIKEAGKPLTEVAFDRNKQLGAVDHAKYDEERAAKSRKQAEYVKLLEEQVAGLQKMRISLDNARNLVTNMRQQIGLVLPISQGNLDLDNAHIAKEEAKVNPGIRHQAWVRIKAAPTDTMNAGMQLYYAAQVPLGLAKAHASVATLSPTGVLGGLFDAAYAGIKAAMIEIPFFSDSYADTREKERQSDAAKREEGIKKEVTFDEAFIGLLENIEELFNTASEKIDALKKEIADKEAEINGFLSEVKRLDPAAFIEQEQKLADEYKRIIEERNNLVQKYAEAISGVQKMSYAFSKSFSELNGGIFQKIKNKIIGADPHVILFGKSIEILAKHMKEMGDSLGAIANDQQKDAESAKRTPVAELVSNLSELAARVKAEVVDRVIADEQEDKKKQQQPDVK